MDENTIERIGMALADRAYAYRLFHVALGAEPNAEELGVLSSEQTRAVFGRLAKADVANAKRLAVRTYTRGSRPIWAKTRRFSRKARSMCASVTRNTALRPK